VLQPTVTYHVCKIGCCLIDGTFLLQIFCQIRDREKVTRGIKKMDSIMFDGYQMYHNYLRPHMALDGKTPSEACGIEIKGDNKWITLIQNASKN